MNSNIIFEISYYPLLQQTIKKKKKEEEKRKKKKKKKKEEKEIGKRRLTGKKRPTITANKGNDIITFFIDIQIIIIII